MQHHAVICSSSYFSPYLHLLSPSPSTYHTPSFLTDTTSSRSNTDEMRPPFAISTVLCNLLAATLAVCACAAEASNIRGASDLRIRDLAQRANDQSAATVAAGPSTTAKTNNGQPNFTFDELYKLQTRFLDNFLSPANAAQAKSINSSLLAENVQVCISSTQKQQLITVGSCRRYPHLRRPRTKYRVSPPRPHHTHLTPADTSSASSPTSPQPPPSPSSATPLPTPSSNSPQTPTSPPPLPASSFLSPPSPSPSPSQSPPGTSSTPPAKSSNTTPPSCAPNGSSTPSSRAQPRN